MSKGTILVLEDEHNWQREIKEMLEAADFSVRIAATLEAAIKAL